MSPKKKQNIMSNRRKRTHASRKMDWSLITSESITDQEIISSSSTSNSSSDLDNTLDNNSDSDSEGSASKKSPKIPPAEFKSDAASHYTSVLCLGASGSGKTTFLLNYISFLVGCTSRIYLLSPDAVNIQTKLQGHNPIEVVQSPADLLDAPCDTILWADDLALQDAKILTILTQLGNVLLRRKRQILLVTAHSPQYAKCSLFLPVFKLILLFGGFSNPTLVKYMSKTLHIEAPPIPQHRSVISFSLSLKKAQVFTVGPFHDFGEEPSLFPNLSSSVNAIASYLVRAIKNQKLRDDVFNFDTMTFRGPKGTRLFLADYSSFMANPCFAASLTSAEKASFQRLTVKLQRYQIFIPLSLQKNVR